jgi:hypothetical protein
LLQSGVLRALLWTQAVMAVAGNLSVLVYRVVFESTRRRRASFPVLVTHLCLADLGMGVYLVIVGVADLRLRGHYLWQQGSWVDSAWCQVAGFLALVSCEVSSFIICLITLDRFIVLRFPLNNSRHVTWRMSWVLCGLCWLVRRLVTQYTSSICCPFSKREQ